MRISDVFAMGGGRGGDCGCGGGRCCGDDHIGYYSSLFGPYSAYGNGRSNSYRIYRGCYSDEHGYLSCPSY